MIPFEFLPGVMVRAPFYVWKDYDLSRVGQVLADVAFRQALFLASPAFYGLVEAKGFDWGRLSVREQHTVAKYVNRMCFRPVPFGAFASFGVVGKGGDTVLHLFPDGFDRPVLQRPVRGDTWLYVNPTVYKLGTHYRYVFSQWDSKGKATFRLDAIDAVRFNRDLLGLFKPGPVRAGDLQEWVVRESECGAESAADYVYFLVEEQVLFTKGQGLVIGAIPGDRVKFPGQIIADKPYYAALERNSPAVIHTDDLMPVIQALRKLVPVQQHRTLEQFKKDFKRRFDRQRVPLLLALDPDAGIGYGEQRPPLNYLLSDLPFKPMRAGRLQVDWQPVHQLLLRLWKGDSEPVVLKDEDLATLDEPIWPLPPTMPISFRHTVAGMVIDYAAGVSGLQLAGRFSIFSDDIHAQCIAIAGAEQAANPDVIFADIGALSDGHVDNINRRRPVYDYEIPVNVCSALPLEQQLPPADLLLSIQGDELILESARLGKRVIPRLATAFNYQRCELSLFRLLGDLQYEGVQGSLAFDLPALFPRLSFYPRVVYRDVVLSLAKWHLKPAEIKLADLPRYVSVGATDQQLVFDLENEADFFWRCIGKQATVAITEYLLPAGEQAEQYVAFLINRETVYKGCDSVRKFKVKRSFPLGSDWLYLKLFCSPATADEVIAQVFATVVKKYNREIRNWFFIRYEEDGHHLRVRIRSNGDIGLLLIAVQKALKVSGLAERVKAIQGDTYHREVERYGAGIEKVEAVFRESSELIISYGPLNETALFCHGLNDAYGIASSFFQDETGLLAFVHQMADTFLAEFGHDRSLKVALDLKYRGLKKQLEVQPTSFKTLAVLVAAVSYKSLKTRTGLAADLIHMHINRLYNYEQRKQELLSYYCLYKYLRSKRSGFDLLKKGYAVSPADR
ncbi:MAG: thiopeptide-type bacteriocin biosynthesis protein [Bacteroidota bacterium]